jgi:glycerol-3-phosphate O-acyltransferase / dihydroxyacetone phosphate acyltransferase
MNSILRITYRLLQGVAVVATEIYFRKIVFINRQHLASDAPLVVICNHPNTVVDPLLAVMYTREPCYLLANYSLFKNPIAGAILRTLFCIPVKRVKDVAEGEERNNDDAFRASEEHLMAGRSLFVAAEGSSYAERHIRTFKTGAARIIFEAESKTDFALNLKILPIGLTYFDPLKFGSDVVVEVGEPFSADDWQARYAENKSQTIDDFTLFVEKKFHDLTIHCADAQEDCFLQKLEAVAQSDEPLDTEGVYFRSKKILAEAQNWKKTDAAGFATFEQQVEAYFSRLNETKIKDVNPTTFGAVASFWKSLIGLPFLMVGLIPNFIPAWLSHGLVKWLNLDAAYDTTVRMLAGLVLFPLFWWLETELLFLLFFPERDNCFSVRSGELNFIESLLLIGFYILSGLLAWRVYTEGGRFLNFQKYKRADADGVLTALRQPIAAALSLGIVPAFPQTAQLDVNS